VLVEGPMNEKRGGRTPLSHEGLGMEICAPTDGTHKSENRS
jgi:hypothetical protein